MKKILIIEDEEKISKILSMYLKREFYDIDIANEGRTGLEKALANEYNLIILDLMLPNLSGEEILEQLREFKKTPVLILSAKIEDKDKINGLMLGADDYVTKPMNPREIVLRVKAIIGRTSNENNKNNLAINDLQMDLNKHSTFYKNNDITLTDYEFKILFRLASNPGIVYSRSKLIDILSEDDYFISDRTIDVHIKNIRKKIHSNIIQTVYKVGYKFDEEN